MTYAYLFGCNDTPLPTVDLNTESHDEGCDQEISDGIEQLCISLLNLLEGAAREPKQKKITPTAEENHDEGVRLRDRAELVEKCFEFYDRLLDIKYAGNYMVIHLVMTCIIYKVGIVSYTYIR